MSPAVRSLDRVDPSVFDGPVVEASAWPAIDVSGRRVGMIVTSRVGMELVRHVACRASRTTVFHRHPAHVLPNLPIVGGTRVWPVTRRVAALHRRLAVRDRETRRQLTPLGSRDVVRSNRWYPTLQRDNCRLISWPITAVTAAGVRTADGVEHVFDLLIVD